MSASVVAADALPPTSRGIVVPGRVFVHPLFDYLLIGGGLSLAFTAVVAAGGGAQRMMNEGLPMSGQGAVLVAPRLEHAGQGIERMQLGGRNRGQRAKLAGGASEVAAAFEVVASLEQVVGEEGWTAVRHHAHATGGEEPEEAADPEQEQGPIDPLQSPRRTPSDVDRRH